MLVVMDVVGLLLLLLLLLPLTISNAITVLQ